jgi:hypothetical protein
MTPDTSIAAYLLTLVLPPAIFATVLGFFALVRFIGRRLGVISA